MTETMPFDVRPLLAGGNDPLKYVLARAHGIDPGGTLIVDAPFDPQPLRRVLGRMGFSSSATKLADRHYRITFHRDGEGSLQGEPMPEACGGLPDVGAPVRARADGVHIDVRGMEPPQPMVAILRLCAAVSDDASIIVHHDRDPIYLYPELAEIGWRSQSLPAEAGEVRLLLQRDAR